jgi:hypothetical protein
MQQGTGGEARPAGYSARPLRRGGATLSTTRRDASASRVTVLTGAPAAKRSTTTYRLNEVRGITLGMGTGIPTVVYRCFGNLSMQQLCLANTLRLIRS